MPGTNAQDSLPQPAEPPLSREFASGEGATPEAYREEPGAQIPFPPPDQRPFFDSLQDCVYVVGEDYRLRYLNPAIREQFGEPGERKCHEYLHGLPSPCTWCKNERVLRGESVRWECAFETVGKRFDLTETLLPSAPGGARARSKVVIFRDVTRQRAAEEALLESQGFNATIIKSLGEGLVVYDRELRYTVCNPFMEELTGIPAAAVIGRKAVEVFPHLKQKGVDLLLERALAGETVTSPEIEYFVPQTGRRGWVVGVYSPHLNARGETQGVVGLIRDVTQRKRASEALRRSERELRIMNRVSKAFLSTEGDDLYSEVLQIAQEALESRFGFLGTIDERGALVCPTLTREIWDRCQMPDKSAVFPRQAWAGLWGRALAERKTLTSNGPLQVPEGHVPLTRAVSAPIVFRNELLGLITVANKAADYEAQDVNLLETIAGHIASILFARSERDKQAQARRRAEDALQTLRKQLTGELGFSGIVGRNARMVEVFETIREVASVDVPILILGESGTGKELVAAAIHQRGPRSDGPFVPVNCSALPAGLLESELFGHVRGAFTGATRDKKGRFELAKGGTVFLDEVGDLSPVIQVKLLRVLQEGTFEKVGSESTQRLEARVVSATHRDLRRLIREGKFREDLYYRLCVVPIELPPLRERREDIPLIVSHCLERIAEETGSPVGISEEALDLLMRHQWPGNIRELRNALVYARVKCRGSIVETRDLPASVTVALHGPRAGRPGAPGSRRGPKPKLTPSETLRAIEEAGGNKKTAARRLGVSRGTLYKYLSQLAMGDTSRTLTVVRRPPREGSDGGGPGRVHRAPRHQEGG